MSGVRRAHTVGFDQVEGERSGPHFAEQACTMSEQRVILVGIRAGDIALARFEQSGVLVLFVERAVSEPASLRLDALQSYAELRRALLSRGLDVPPTSLVALGFTITQIARFDRMIAGAPTFAPLGRQTSKYSRQLKTSR